MEESNSLYIYVHCTVSQSKLLTFKKFNKIRNMHKGRKLPSRQIIESVGLGWVT